MPDFQNLAKKFKDLIKDLGIQKEELEAIVASGETDTKRTQVLVKLEAATKKVRKLLSQNTISKEEQERKIKSLESRIEIQQLMIGTEPDLSVRLKEERELSRLKARLGVWKAQEVFHFEELIDESGEELGELMREAEKDVRSRKNLQRVLKGVEVALRVTAFGAALSAKMAAAAA